MDIVKYGSLMHEIMDFAKLLSPDPYFDGYSLYSIEFSSKGVGLTISAKKRSRELGGEWNIRTWSTYNV
jgi:hypothetical protein